VLAVATCSCDATPCPETWSGAVDQGSFCEPPPAVRARAEAHLTTGIYGYAVWTEPYNGGEDAEVTDTPTDVMAAGDGPLPLTVYSIGSPFVETHVDLPLREDGTFEIELPPGAISPDRRGGSLINRWSYSPEIREGDIRFVVLGQLENP
jgi:hypothetical protein